MSRVSRYLIDHSFGWRELNDALIRVDGPSDDGSIREDELMVFATDHDAACRERDEQITRLREALDSCVAYFDGNCVDGECDSIKAATIAAEKARAALAEREDT